MEELKEIRKALLEHLTGLEYENFNLEERFDGKTTLSLLKEVIDAKVELEKFIDYMGNHSIITDEKLQTIFEKEKETIDEKQ